MHLLVFEPPRLCRLCFFRFRTSRASYKALRVKRAFSEGFFVFGDFFLFFFVPTMCMCVYITRSSKGDVRGQVMAHGAAAHAATCRAPPLCSRYANKASKACVKHAFTSMRLQLCVCVCPFVTVSVAVYVSVSVCVSLSLCLCRCLCESARVLKKKRNMLQCTLEDTYCVCVCVCV